MSSIRGSGSADATASSPQTTTGDRNVSKLEMYGCGDANWMRGLSEASTPVQASSIAAFRPRIVGASREERSARSAAVVWTQTRSMSLRL